MEPWNLETRTNHSENEQLKTEAARVQNPLQPAESGRKWWSEYV